MSARPPTLPTVAALAMEPMPSTMVQKITGPIIILMSLTKPSPDWFQGFGELGEQQPDDGARNHGDNDGHVQVVGLVEPFAAGLGQRVVLRS